jgi:hypothetical protein
MPQPDTIIATTTTAHVLTSREHKTLQNRLSMRDINDTPRHSTDRRLGIQKNFDDMRNT